MISHLGNNFDFVMTSYFKDFKKEMKQRFRIPKSLIETYAKDICFLVDTDYTYA